MKDTTPSWWPSRCTAPPGLPILAYAHFGLAHTPGRRLVAIEFIDEGLALQARSNPTLEVFIRERVADALQRAVDKLGPWTSNPIDIEVSVSPMSWSGGVIYRAVTRVGPRPLAS